MARPRAPIDVAEVERLASLGLTHAQICAALGIHPETLRRRRKDGEALDAALARGRATGTAEVASALFEKATGGDLRAQMFYLKTRAGWTEPQARPHYSSDPLENDDTTRAIDSLAQRPIPIWQRRPAFRYVKSTK